VTRPLLDRMAKRTLDIVGSACGLLLLSPLLIAVGVWVRLDSAGPAFFRQERVGRGGRPFRIHKFRTMRVADREGVRAITVGADMRITDVASLTYRNESELLARAADPEREYREVVLPAKLRLSTLYLEQATLASDLRLIGRTLKTIFIA